MAKAGSTNELAEKALNKAMPSFATVKFGTLIRAIIAALNGATLAIDAALLSSAGLVIKAGGSAIVKAGSAFIANCGGVHVRKTANTDMAALAGTLATAKSAAWAFYIDAAGTLTTSAKTADAADHASALALVPSPPLGLAQIGILVLDNATGSPFVGGTTALDVGSLTATYYNTIGPIPNAANVLVRDLVGW